MKRKRKERYRLWAAVAVLYAVVLPVSGLMGMTENRQKCPDAKRIGQRGGAGK